MGMTAQNNKWINKVAEMQNRIDSLEQQLEEKETIIVQQARVNNECREEYQNRIAELESLLQEEKRQHLGCDTELDHAKSLLQARYGEIVLAKSGEVV